MNELRAILFFCGACLCLAACGGDSSVADMGATTADLSSPGAGSDCLFEFKCIENCDTSSCKTACYQSKSGDNSNLAQLDICVIDACTATGDCTGINDESSGCFSCQNQLGKSILNNQSNKCQTEYATCQQP